MRARIVLATAAVFAALACSAGLLIPAGQDILARGVAPSEGPPLSIIPNRGQVDEHAAYHAQAPGAAFFFTRNSVRMALARGGRGARVDLRFIGARDALPVPVHRQPGRVSYFSGRERYAGLPTYGGIVYRELWPGIDMALRGAGGTLKYEFRLRPGADPAAIRLAYRGARVRSAASGALLVRTPAGTLTDSRPQSFELVGGRRVPVQSRFRLRGDGSVGFGVARHDVGRSLVIDPGIGYSSFHGGSGAGEDEEIEYTTGIAVDSEGSAYVTGLTVSNDFPTTTGAFDTTRGGGDAFVSKFSPDGSQLVYSTFLGGSAAERGLAIAVDSEGSAYVTGTTRSADFPITPNAYDSTLGGSDVFLTRLAPSGASLLYSTFFGGSDAPSGPSASGVSPAGIAVAYEQPSAVAIGPGGTAVVAGDTSSSDFPTTPGAFDRTLNGGIADAFVARLDTSSPALLHSTLLGGAGSDHVLGLAVDPEGHAYITGYTHSHDYPTTPGAFDEAFDGEPDGFLTKLEPDAAGLSYSTLLGGTDQDFLVDVALDDAGSAYVVGTTSSPDFPTTPGAFQDERRGPTDAFVAKLMPSGSALDFATLLGGGYYDNPGGIDVDARGRAVVAGSASGGYPTTPDAHRTTFDTQDVFLTRLNVSGTALSYSTALGGSSYEMGRDVALDPKGNAYVTGQAFSIDFPVTDGAFDQQYNFADSFVTKFSLAPGPPARVELTPESASPVVGEEHCVSAAVTDAAGAATPDIQVRFSIAGVEQGSAVTGDAGTTSFCYRGPELPRTDSVQAYADTDGDGGQGTGEPADTAAVAWAPPETTPGCEVTTVGRLRASNGDVATVGGNAATTTAVLTGRPTYRDHGPAQPFRLKSVALDALACGYRRATVFGEAAVKPGGVVAYRIDVTDGALANTYRILLGNGYDSGVQRLRSGRVRVRG